MTFLGLTFTAPSFAELCCLMSLSLALTQIVRHVLARRTLSQYRVLCEAGGLVYLEHRKSGERRFMLAARTRLWGAQINRAWLTKRSAQFNSADLERLCPAVLNEPQVRDKVLRL